MLQLRKNSPFCNNKMGYFLHLLEGVQRGQAPFAIQTLLQGERSDSETKY